MIYDLNWFICSNTNNQGIIYIFVLIPGFQVWIFGGSWIDFDSKLMMENVSKLSFSA